MTVFKWLHMKEHVCKQRIRFLSDRLEPYLADGDSVFDMFCGYSPLCEMVLAKGLSLFGIDGNKDAIKWLKNNYPKGTWRYQWFTENMTTSLSGCNVLLLLGVGEPQHEPSFQVFLTNMLGDNSVRVIMTETLKPNTRKPWYDGYTRNKHVMEFCGYSEAETGLYETTEPVHHIRDYSIYVRTQNSLEKT